MRAVRRETTALRVQQIAVDMALARGSDAVTVEAVAGQASISVRTFYNYFPSKDAAVLGDALSGPSPAAAKAFVSGSAGDLLTEIIGICARDAPQSPELAELAAKRTLLLRQEPELASRTSRNFATLMDDLTELVAARLKAQGREAADTQEISELIVAITGAVMHWAMLKYPTAAFERGADTADIRARARTAMHLLAGFDDAPPESSSPSSGQPSPSDERAPRHEVESHPEADHTPHPA